MSILRYGIIDIINSFRKYDLIRMLGRQYMVLRYRRSKLGPFWITISMGIQILTLGLIFGQLFDASIHKFFPFLAIGIILWNYITAIISEGSTSFISSTGMITQLELPIAFYFFFSSFVNIKAKTFDHTSINLLNLSNYGQSKKTDKSSVKPTR